MQIDSELDNIKTGQDKFKFLRKKFSKFIYDKFEYVINYKEKFIFIKFHFIQMELNYKTKQLDKFIEFNPTLKLELNSKKNKTIKDLYKNLDNEDILEKIIFNIGMIELISYWKACVSPIIIIKPKFILTTRQIKFWKEIYINGLGEYLYLNRITVSKDDIFDILPYKKIDMNKDKPNATPLFFTENKNLIPIGGGKDSIVSIELIRELYKNNTDGRNSNSFDNNNYAIILNPREATLKTAEIAGFDKEKIIIAKRTIDKNLLYLNSKGYLNGHTPFSALLSFVTALVSYTYGIKNIVLSNEDSASESNVRFNELEINHQYSKSFEAEKELNWYIKKYTHKSINYFSLLRPLYEIQIASLFSKHATNYFKDFRSCNAGSKKNIWCLNCPKCLFVYIILSPFISQEQLVEEIFGENLLNRIDLEDMFFELLGEREKKPFECVGTYEEVKTSMFLLNKKLLNSGNSTKQFPLLLTRFNHFYKGKKNDLLKIEQDSQTIFKHFNTENLIPTKMSKMIQRVIKKG